MRLFQSILIIFTFFPFYGQSSSVDSLTILLQNANSNTTKAQFLHEIGLEYYAQKDVETAIVQYKKALSLLTNSKELDLLANVYLDLGYAYYDGKIFQLDSAYQQIIKVIPILEQLNSTTRIKAYRRLLSIHYSLNRFEEATQYCIQCIDYAKEIDDSYNFRFCLSRLSTFTLLFSGDTTKVISYNYEAIQSAIKDKDTYEIAYYYLMLLSDISDQKFKRSTIPYIDTCRTYIAQAFNERLWQNFYLIAGIGYFKNNLFDLSEEHLQKGLEIATKQQSWSRAMHFRINFAELYLAQKDFPKAIRYASEALSIAPDKLTLYELDMANRQLYEAYKNVNNYKQALYHLEEWKTYKDSTEHLNKTGVIVGLENKYKNVEQQKLIEIQDIQLKKERQQRNIIFIFLGFLALLSTALAMLFIKMRRSRGEIRQQNKIITQQAKDLQQLDEVKSRFFANVSHELRTPLTLILGPIHTAIKSGELGNRNFTLLKKAEQSGTDLLKLISSILDLSKMESGNMELQEQEVAVFPFFRRTISSFESHAEQRGISFIFNYQVESGLKLLLDKDKVRIILNNLLSNALKFTPKGGKVGIEILEQENKLQIIVSDTGRGIHQDDLPHVFNRFYQAKKEHQVAEGGTGIGLALCQEYIKLMKGKIWLESQLGKGSTFFIEIPYKEVLGAKDVLEETNMEAMAEAVLPTHSSASVHQTTTQKVLIVEDNYSLRDYLIMVLEPHFQVNAVENGQVALNLLTQSNQSKNDAFFPDLIVSDIMMPVLDGFQLLEHLKSSDQFRHVPVVMLTARAGIQDKLKALRIGVDDYLLKPFVEEELIARISNLLENVKNRHINDDSKQQENVLIDAHNIPTISLEDQKWLTSFEAYLKQEVGNTQLTMVQIAHKFSMSESTLSRQLKRLTGLTPFKYFQEIRWQTARQMIEQRQYNSIHQIAHDIGFKDSKTFSRGFKKRFGKTPTAYLNN